MRHVLLAATVLCPALAAAQPASVGDRGDAKALVQTGVKLLEAKDYLGALATFKEAYSRYPSAKILLNIGTTLRLLGRDADAANTYQRYLDSKDADTARSIEVTQALSELDAKVGRISLQVTPADAEIQVGDEWMPAAKAKVVRFTPGEVKISARKAGFTSATTTVKAIAGTETMAALTLTAVAGPPVVTPTDTSIQKTEPLYEGSDVMVPSEKPRARIGAIANVHVSVYPKLGSAAFVGGTVEVIPKLYVDAALILGPGLVSDGMATLEPPSFGGYIGASYALSLMPAREKTLQFRVGGGMPIFSSNGARFALRAALGAEYIATRHLSVIVELGGERQLNPETDINDIAFVPALGVTGRL